MSALDPRIEAVRQQYGLEASDFWELPQKKGTWVAKHSALEVAAAKAGIEFDNPMIVEANSEAGIAVVSVRGMQPNADGVMRSEWSIGEASPKNNRNAYPFAMAEKRAKDRVILKLIGIHGLVYSEDEMSGPTVEEHAPPKQLVKDSRAADKDIRAEVDACATGSDLEMLWRSKPFQADYAKLHATYRDGILELFSERKAFLATNPAKGFA